MPAILEFNWGKFPKALLEARSYDADNQPERARASYLAALRVVESNLRKAPGDEITHRQLGSIYAALGRREDAIREAKGCVERAWKTGGVLDAMDSMTDLAVVYAKAGETELALDQLEYLLSVPSTVSYGWLRLIPELKAVRGHPRFQKLLAQAAQPLPLPRP